MPVTHPITQRLKVLKGQKERLERQIMPIQKSLYEIEQEISRLRRECPHPQDQLTSSGQYKETDVDDEGMIDEFYVYCYDCGVCGESLEFMSEQHDNEEDENHV